MKIMFSILIYSAAIVSVKTACLNNCSQNGLCENTQCSCNWNYIGSDCSVKAYPLKLGVSLTTRESGTYYLYHRFAEDDPISQQLDFTYDNYQSCRVQILISSFKQLTIEFYQSAYLSSDQSLSIELSPEVQRNSNIIIIQIDSIYNSDLTTTYGKEQQDSVGLILAIVLPIVSIVIIVIIFLCCFKRIKRMWQQRYLERNIPSQPRENPVYLEQRYNATYQMPDQQPISLYNPNEECSICLQTLLNGMPVVITPCQHKFHGNCIFEVLMRQQTCPNCRAFVQPHQLQGLPEHNQIQALVV